MSSSPIRRRAHAAALWSVAVAAVAAATGCSTQAGAATPAPAAAMAPADQATPGPVAVAYTQALLSGDLTGASRYVLPADRGTLASVPIPTDIVVRSENLAVGSATVGDSTATVVLTGRICNVTPPRTHSGMPSAQPSAPSCISNADPHSSNPLFRVAMVRGTDQKWYVSYPGAPAK